MTAWTSPSDAKVKYQNVLTYHEQNEINEYGAVFYAGENAAGRKNNSGYGTSGAADNNGFDNPADGQYKVVPGDHIAYRFEIIKQLGRGTSSVVVKAFDYRTQKNVAIKITANRDVFKDNAIQEVQILEELKRDDKDAKYNVVHFSEYFTFRNHFCIVFELLSMNLYELIQKNNFKGFSLRLIRSFSQSILEALSLLKSKNIIHCDLKPENILLREKGKSNIKIIDFGSACFEGYSMYQYIQSRAYRSPEVILGCKYTGAIDMWSLGCILTELFTGHTLFPGCDEEDQLGCIIEMLGMPSASMMAKSDRKYNFITSKGHPRYCTETSPEGNVKYVKKANKIGRSRGLPATKPLHTVLANCEDKAFFDFIERCLTMDPTRRLTPTQAMQHEFIKGTASSTTQRKTSYQPSATASHLKNSHSTANIQSARHHQTDNHHQHYQSTTNTVAHNAKTSSNNLRRSHTIKETTTDHSARPKRNTSHHRHSQYQQQQPQQPHQKPSSTTRETRNHAAAPVVAAPLAKSMSYYHVDKKTAATVIQPPQPTPRKTAAPKVVSAAVSQPTIAKSMSYYHQPTIQPNPAAPTTTTTTATTAKQPTTTTTTHPLTQAQSYSYANSSRYPQQQQQQQQPATTTTQVAATRGAGGTAAGYDYAAYYKWYDQQYGPAYGAQLRNYYGQGGQQQQPVATMGTNGYQTMRPAQSFAYY